MKVRFNGVSPVDIAGHDNVQPGDVVDVTDAHGAALLRAGTSIDEATGQLIAPKNPLWTAPPADTPVTTTEPAEAGEEA